MTDKDLYILTQDIYWKVEQGRCNDAVKILRKLMHDAIISQQAADLEPKLPTDDVIVPQETK